MNPWEIDLTGDGEPAEVYEVELTEEDMTEEAEEYGLELEAEEVVTVPVGIPIEWDHQFLRNRDAPDCHPLEAVKGLPELKARVDAMEPGAQVNVIDTVKVNGIAQEVVSKAVDIAVPVSYGWTLELGTAGTIYLKDKTGGVLSKIETGLDRVVKSGYFDEDTVEIVLVLDDDKEIRINASSLVDVYTADGYYITETGREFGLSENAKSILTDSTKHNARRDNPHNVTKAQVGLDKADNTADKDKPISDKAQAALDLKADASALKAHADSRANPHKVTKAQIGLGNADNTADLAKPVSVAQQAALDLKAEKAPTEAHIANTSNPHNVTKDQIGLPNVDDTSDADKPVSKATQAALDKKADADALGTHITDKENPHEVTKAQIGLGEVDNTSDLAKPVSTATQGALDGKVDKVTGKGLSTEDYTSADKAKLTGIAAGAQVNVVEVVKVNGTKAEPTDKAVDITVPTKVSDLTNDTGFVTKAVGDLVNYYTKAQTYTRAEINALIAGTLKFQKVDSLPTAGESNVIYLVPKAGSGDDVHDEYIYIDGAWELIGSTQITVDVVNGDAGITVAGVELQKATQAHPGLMTVEQVNALAGKAEKASTDAHIGNRENPHNVTKAQLGLGSVDNTSDADKPISTATQAALDLKADASALDGYVPTARKVNGKPLSADVTLTFADVGALSADTHIPEGSVVDPDFSETSVNPVQNKIITARLKTLATKAELEAHTGNTSNPHGVTKADVGLGSVDNTSDADKPVSTAQAQAIGQKADASDLTAHKGNTSNPHNVTKAQIGLGNVDNTSDLDKPISTATQGALDGKASATALSDHVLDKTNPHGVTKAQVGLGSVDNTADKDKPISTKAQNALDGKVDKVTGKGLSAEDFTSALKTKLSELYTKAQLDAKFAGIVQWSAVVVDALPATGQAATIYLVPKEGSDKDVHDEYLWIDSKWELIGSTQIDFPPASSTQDGLMTKQHVQKLTAVENGLSTAQGEIATLKTEQIAQDGRLDDVESVASGAKTTAEAAKTKADNAIPQGGTLSKPLKVTGGDQATAGKIILDQSNKGQITDTSTATLLGFTGADTLAVGSSSYNIALRGKQTRPTWNGSDLALKSDVDPLAAKAGVYRGSFTGDGSTKVFTLTHSLGGMPAVTLYKGSAMMLTDTEATTTTVKFTFNTAPASGAQFTAVLIG